MGILQSYVAQATDCKFSHLLIFQPPNATTTPKGRRTMHQLN